MANEGDVPGVTLNDNPEMDATDYAHPAWWRGNDAAVDTLCRMINDILDGKELAGVSREPWEATRRRIADTLHSVNLKLRWETDEKGKHLTLYAGLLEIADLRKATKWWELVVWLPQVGKYKQYGPLEDQQKQAEEIARKWFNSAVRHHGAART